MLALKILYYRYFTRYWYVPVIDGTEIHFTGRVGKSFIIEVV